VLKIIYITVSGSTLSSDEYQRRRTNPSYSVTIQQKQLSHSADNYRVAQKSKPPPIFQKIALKIAIEIRFLRKVKV